MQTNQSWVYTTNRVPISYTPSQYFPYPKSSLARYQEIETKNTIAQSLKKLIKLASSKLFILPSLAFPREAQQKP